MTDKPKLGRPSKLFDATGAAHAVFRAAESMGWDIQDREAFLKRVQHVEYGLSAEIEFATILRWLGICKFVHRLNEDRLAAEAFEKLEIPDLFAVFQHGGFKTSALIEVKTSEDMTLSFTKAYLDKLAAYAAHMSQPLLIAWRPRAIGFWVLFDPAGVPVTGGRVELTFDYAIRNDLMSYLAGDVTICPLENAGLRIAAERTGAKIPTDNGFQAMFTIKDTCFHGPDGVAAEIAPAVSWLVLSTVEYSEEVTDDRYVQSYLCNESMTRAQMVLRTAVFFSISEDERIHWKAVHDNLNAVLDCQQLLAGAEESFGVFVHLILYQQPQTIPAFLQGWQPPHVPRSRSKA